MPANDLVGVSEIAAMAGVARNTAWRWSNREGFPKPAASLSQGRVWRRGDVERWIAKRRPVPGRPATH